MQVTNNGKAIFTGSHQNWMAQKETIINELDIDEGDLTLNYHPSELKGVIQNNISRAFTGGMSEKDKLTLALSLCGKLSNALSGALAIHMDIYQNLAQAQSLADVRGSISPAVPLMQRVGAMKQAEEVVTVQHVQLDGVDTANEDAVIEGLEAMTVAARVIAEHKASAVTV